MTRVNAPALYNVCLLLLTHGDSEERDRAESLLSYLVFRLRSPVIELPDELDTPYALAHCRALELAQGLNKCSS